MFERYTEKARRTIFFARYEASQFGSPSIETEHLLLGLLREDPDLAIFFPGQGIVRGAPSADIPQEVTETEKRIKYIVQRMENAIANQEIEKARFYSEEERKERENLRQLRLAHNLQGEDDAFDSGILTDIRRQIEARTTQREKVSTSVDLPLSQESKRALTYGAEEAERLNQRHIGTEHLLLGLLREEKCFAAEILREQGVRLALVRQQVAQSPPAEPGRPGFGFHRSPGRVGSMFGPPRHRPGLHRMPFLQNAERILYLARHEAAKRQSASIGTADLLLALTHEKEATERFLPQAETIRRHKNLESSPLRERVSAEELPFSEECKLALAFATEESAQLGQRIGPGHLLLGMLRVESCAAAEILRDCGFTEAGIRAQLVPPPPSSDPEQGRNYV